jgi:hypothetical protein
MCSYNAVNKQVAVAMVARLRVCMQRTANCLRLLLASLQRANVRL